MFNKELLLSGGRVDAEPHVIMTIDYTSDNFFIYWDYNLTTFYTSEATTPFFHDLGQGDSVGIFFDPPPDGYL